MIDPASMAELRAVYTARPELAALEARFAALDPVAPPCAALIEAAARPAATVGIMAGSFDPLTNAHLALARAARDAGGCAAVYLALSRHTVDKEARVRPTDAERALLLRQVARREPGLGVLAFNRGLYADQALAARALFPHAREIRFVVGFDKARQIFDPRYYADRDAALRQLFAHVALLVAPRANDGADVLVALLDRPENRPFRDRVRALPLDRAWADDSATRVRAAVASGDTAALAALVPPETVAWIAALRPYGAVVSSQ
jgi:nicotinamide-nucleotide adenylyltransferase